ncbi:MAG: LysR substrate-binding domain-containing protein [Pseudomonadales bacterium]
MNEYYGDINHFLVFNSAYKTRNLSLVERDLCLTRSEISSALDSLRNHFCDDLLIDSDGVLSSTALADQLGPIVNEALQQLNAGLRYSKTFDPQLSKRTFVIGVTGICETLFIPGLVNYVNEYAPGVSISSYVLHQNDFNEALSKGRTDLVLGSSLSAASPTIAQIPICKDYFVCALNTEHKKAQNQLTLQSYLDLEHIGISSWNSEYEVVDSALMYQGMRRNIRLKVEQIGTALEIVKNSEMAITVPLQMAKNSGLQILELPIRLPQRDWVAYCHKRAEDDPAIQWICEVIQSIYSSTS